MNGHYDALHFILTGVALIAGIIIGLYGVARINAIYEMVRTFSTSVHIEPCEALRELSRKIATAESEEQRDGG